MSMKSLCAAVAAVMTAAAVMPSLSDAAVLTTSPADGATFELLPDAQTKLPKSGLLGPVSIYSRKIEGK